MSANVLKEMRKSGKMRGLLSLINSIGSTNVRFYLSYDFLTAYFGVKTVYILP